MDKRRQILSIIVIVVLIAATIAVWWWSKRPLVSDDTAVRAFPKKERKLPEALFSDPRFQALRSEGGVIDVGPQGNSNPFEPFAPRTTNP